MRQIVAILTVTLLAGCHHNLTLVSREGSETGKGKATGAGGSGHLSIDLHGKHYEGQWVSVASGGGIGLIQTYGAHPTSGTVISSGAQSTGNALLSSADGSGLRCDVRIH
jgi:hypothetical protein